MIKKLKANLRKKKPGVKNMNIQKCSQIIKKQNTVEPNGDELKINIVCSVTLLLRRIIWRVSQKKEPFMCPYETREEQEALDIVLDHEKIAGLLGTNFGGGLDN